MGITIAVIGDNSAIGNSFGKEGTKSDMTFYNTPELTAIVPHTYPEKIIPMLQAIEFADFIVFAQEKIDWTFGEILLALDIKRKPGIFLHKGYEKERIKALSKGTFCERYGIASGIGEIKNAISKFSPKERNFTVIDHFFEVKGVGLVVLGELKGGKVSAYEKLTIYPQKKEIVLKSMQVHDIDKKEISGFSRVGYSIKGIKLNELERGSIISKKEIKVSDAIENEIIYNRFSKPLKKGESAMACFGAQARTIIVNDKLNISKPTALNTNGIVFRNDFKGKLRIIGSIVP